MALQIPSTQSFKLPGYNWRRGKSAWDKHTWLYISVIIAVVCVNAIVGLMQEGRAEKSLNAIRGLISPEATVVRDGLRKRVPARDLVSGDVVVVEAGDRCPAGLERGRGIACLDVARHQRGG